MASFSDPTLTSDLSLVPIWSLMRTCMKNGHTVCTLDVGAIAPFRTAVFEYGRFFVRPRHGVSVLSFQLQSLGPRRTRSG